MALIGYGRVSTDKQNTQRQLDALTAAGCVKIFTEAISGRLAYKDRPELAKAIDHLRPDDMLCVQEVDRLGRNLLDGLLLLAWLFERDRPITVKVLEGIASGEHTERSLVLDLALALAEDRRRDISRKTKNGLEAARARGNVGGRPTVVDDDKRRAILARRAEEESLREISRGVGISLAVVHRIVTEAEEGSHMTRYTTRDEAIGREIVEPIEASGEARADEYDIEAIADSVLGDHEQGYACQVDEDEFWSLVKQHAR